MNTKICFRLLATALFIGSVCTSATQAEDMTYSDLVKRIEVLEQQLSSQNQETQLVSYEEETKTDTSIIQAAYSNCNRNACGVGFTLYTGYEMLVFQPHFTNVTLGPGFVEDDYGVGHRFVLGTEADTGLGARLRYMMYNHGHSFVPAAPVNLHIDIDALDAEFTLREQLRNWNLLASAGFRYGRLEYRLGPSRVFFEGTGVTGALQGARAIGNSGFYLIGSFRTSLLNGDTHNPAGIIGAAPLLRDETMTILEGQVGGGWARDFGRAQVHIRSVWETQQWLNDNFADPFIGIGSNLTLSGPTFAVEFRF